MKTQVKNTVITVIALFIVSMGFAQKRQLGGPQKDNIEALKVAFFTRQMQLTPEEARVFWPLYDKYQESINVQKKQRRKTLRDAEVSLDEMTDEEINKLIDNRLSQAEIALKDRKEFVSELRKVLPAKKIALYFKAEELFKQKLIEKMNERKMQPPRSRAVEN